MQKSTDGLWRDPVISERYLTEVVGALPLENEQFDIMTRLIKNNGRDVERFLDLGCGNGILSSILLDRYPRAEGILVDFSKTMIDAAKEKLKQYSGKLRFLEVDYSEPSWMDALGNNFFNVVLSRLSIHHQPDEKKYEIYKQIFSALSPGGIFVNIEHVAPASRWSTEIFQDYIVDHLFFAGEQRGEKRSREGIKEDFKSRHEKDANVVASVEKQCDWLRKIGYADVDCFFKVFEIAIFAGRKK